jgi:endonuclease IV
VFMVVLCGIRCDWSFKDEYNKYGKEISKAAKEELKQMIPTLRGQLNEVTSGLDELNGLLKKITRS